jgi:hypothetical protein
VPTTNDACTAETKTLSELRVTVACIEERVNGNTRLQNERQQAAERALDVARHETETARANANEWRGALNDAMVRFVTREEWELQHQVVVKELSNVRDVMSSLTGKGQGADYLWGRLLGVAALGLTLGGIIVGIVLKFKSGG